MAGGAGAGQGAQRGQRVVADAPGPHQLPQRRRQGLVGGLDTRGAHGVGELAEEVGAAAGEGVEKFAAIAEGFDPTGAFAPESYDAAALIMLAMQAAGSSNPADYAGKIMDVANAPGEPILPGELGKALDLIAAGQDVDYVGASAVELIGPGESAGSYREIIIQNGVIETARYR